MFKLKYVGSDKFPQFYTIPTYKENVQVINGIAEVKYKVTADRLLKMGFVLYEEEEEPEVEEPKKKPNKKRKNS